MDKVLWLSGEDVAKTGVCQMETAVKLVEHTFQLFDRGEARIAENLPCASMGTG